MNQQGIQRTYGVVEWSAAILFVAMTVIYFAIPQTFFELDAASFFGWMLGSAGQVVGSVLFAIVVWRASRPLTAFFVLLLPYWFFSFLPTRSLLGENGLGGLLNMLIAAVFTVVAFAVALIRHGDRRKRTRAIAEGASIKPVASVWQSIGWLGLGAVGFWLLQLATRVGIFVVLGQRNESGLRVGLALTVAVFLVALVSLLVWRFKRDVFNYFLLGGLISLGFILLQWLL